VETTSGIPAGWMSKGLDSQYDFPEEVFGHLFELSGAALFST